MTNTSVVSSRLFDKHKTYFARNPEDAKALIATGEYKVPGELNPSELATWTSITRTLFNLHEFIVRNGHGMQVKTAGGYPDQKLRQHFSGDPRWDISIIPRVVPCPSCGRRSRGVAPYECIFNNLEKIMKHKIKFCGLLL